MAESLNLLAVIYLAQGKYAKAEPLYRRALAILKKRVGPDHPNIVKTLNNLAELYEKIGKRVEAAALRDRARRCRKGWADGSEAGGLGGHQDLKWEIPA